MQDHRIYVRNRHSRQIVGRFASRSSRLLAASKRYCSPQKRYYHLVIMCTRLLMFERSNTGALAPLVRRYEKRKRERGPTGTYRREAQGSRDALSSAGCDCSLLSRRSRFDSRDMDGLLVCYVIDPQAETFKKNSIENSHVRISEKPETPYKKCALHYFSFNQNIYKNVKYLKHY